MAREGSGVNPVPLPLKCPTCLVADPYPDRPAIVTRFADIWTEKWVCGICGAPWRRVIAGEGKPYATPELEANDPRQEGGGAITNLP